MNRSQRVSGDEGWLSNPEWEVERLSALESRKGSCFGKSASPVLPSRAVKRSDSIVLPRSIKASVGEREDSRCQRLQSTNRRSDRGWIRTGLRGRQGLVRVGAYNSIKKRISPMTVNIKARSLPCLLFGWIRAPLMNPPMS